MHCFFLGAVFLLATALGAEILEKDEDVHDALVLSRAKRQFLYQNKPNGGLWADRTVNYYFDNSTFDFSLKKSVLSAMEKISAHTCIKYSEEPSDVMLKIVSSDPSNCWAAIGKVGGNDQVLNYIQMCYSSGLAAHELIHVLGFVHEHQRLDRDEYLNVKLNSLQYIKHRPQQILVPYDYGSIMQYAETFGAFTAIDDRYSWTLGSEIIAFYDYLMINEQYECSCDTEIECKNQGYPNPANCSECNCPFGFGGVDCSEMPEGTVKLEATNETQYYEFSLDAGYAQGKNGEKLRQIDFVYKYLWITAPPKKTTVIVLEKVDGTECTKGCIYGGIEVKNHNDPRMTSPRTCCDERDIIRSRNNPTVVMAFNARGVNSYKISYRFR